MKKEELKKSIETILKDTEVGIYDINSFFQKEGVLVDVHAGRYSGKATLNPKVYGVDVEKDEFLSSFRKEYIKGERISFLPASIEKKFISIETATRIKKKEMALGFDDRFMPIEIFKEFYDFFKKQQEKYNEVKEEVLAQWGGLRTSFVNNLDMMLKNLNSIDAEEIKRNILKKAPTLKQFEESCKLEINVMAFPTSSNLKILDESLSEEVRESIEKKSLETVNEVLGNILKDAFLVINNALIKYDETETFKKATIDSILRLRERIGKRNILKHATIKQIESSLNFKDTSNEYICEMLEETLVLIYGFAKSIDIIDYLDLNNSYIEEEMLDSLSNSLDI